MVEYHAHLQPHDSLQELFVLQALFSQRCEDHVVAQYWHNRTQESVDGGAGDLLWACGRLPVQPFDSIHIFLIRYANILRGLERDLGCGPK